ncbi:MFS general substrate transporter [Penicillium capsulatum]|nr:MFS general substrate transporter [Penicillium capsulatum]
MIRGRTDARMAEDLAMIDAYPVDEKTQIGDSLPSHAAHVDQAHSNKVNPHAQAGIQKAEAAALVWSKKVVIGTYMWIWICFFLHVIQSSISSSVVQTAYGNFKAAPQVSTAQILSNVIGGVLKLPIAKIPNLWGRAEGLFVFTVVYMVGIIMLASCNGPNVFAAGYILYWVGYDALYLILDLFIADTFGLRNRAFAFGFASIPFICTAFTGPLAAQSFIKHASWRWAYGAFAIIITVVFLPLILVFKHYQRKAEEMGIYRRRPSGRNFSQSVLHYIREFDLVGAVILISAFVLVLLPFGLQNYGRAEYKTAKFICILVIGAVLFFVFAIWERFYTHTHFVRYELFRDRTVLGACALSGILFFSFYCWDHYFFNFCVVYYHLSIEMAGYMGQIYNTGSCFWSVIVGIDVRYTRRFKHICLYFGLPVVILGTDLIIFFCSGEGSASSGCVVMCQIFIAFAGGTLVIGQNLAVMSSSDREGIPMMLSMLGLFSSLGSTVGYAASSAIYTNVFPHTLYQAPLEDRANFHDIYKGGYAKQNTCRIGSVTRHAIEHAWKSYMKYNCITATAVLVLAIPSTTLWRNYHLDRKQNRGVIM